MTTLTVAATTNFSATTLSNVTNINFTNGVATTVTATFAANQFNGVQIATNVTFTGSLGRNIVAVTGASNLDASGWQFVNWLGTDTITLSGTSASDTIIGSSVGDTVSAGNGNDVVRGGGGLDRLAGGGGNDTFVYGAASELVTGEEIYGGSSAADSGTADAIRVSATVTQVNFTVATISGIERLNFDGAGSHSVRLNETQLLPGGGSIASFNGSAGSDEVEVVMAGGAISLADLVVTNFGASGTDRFVISGGTAAGGESYIGSDVDDLILSSGGADVIAGGLGNDTFRLQNAGQTGGFVFLGSSFVEPDTGIDTIEVNSTGNYDLTTAGLAGIDRLQFTGISTSTRTVILDADQVGAGAINEFRRASGGNATTTNDTIVISGGSIDLSAGLAIDIDAFTLNGSNGNDILAAAGANGATLFTINGLDGDDTIAGSNDGDVLNGGAGNDTFVFNNLSRVGQGTGDTIDAGTGTNDRILFVNTSGTTEDFSVATITGIERFEFGGGDTTIQTARFSAAQLQAIVNINGDAGNDVIQIGDSGTVNLSTLNVASFTGNELVGVTVRQTDRIEFTGGTSGADTFTGSNAGDLMTTTGGADNLSTGNGDDRIVVANGAHLATTLISMGGGTFDILELQGSGSFVLNNKHSGFEKVVFGGATKTVTMAGSHFGAGKVDFISSSGNTTLFVNGNSNLSGLAFGNWGNGTDSITLVGTSLDNVLTGSSRNDTINGDFGNDTLTGGLGVDVINGGGGNDRFLLASRNDTISVINAVLTGDQFNGGSENDTIVQNFAGAGTAGTADLTFSAFDSIEAYEFGGSSTSEQRVSLLQSQIGAGTSRIGAFVANAGNDTVQILYQGGDLSLASLGLTNWTDGADLLFVNALAGASGDGTLTGSAFADRFEMGFGASTTNDTIDAGDGNDVVLANGGNDIVNGGNGVDTIIGGDGNDTISGGAGADITSGGTGADLFIINAGDFAAGESIDGGTDASTDTIRQVANGTVDYTSGTIESIEAFEFAGTAAQTAIFDDFFRPVIFDGNAQINNLVFNMDAPGTFNFGGTFTNWSANDTITLNGSTGNDFVRGSALHETINGGGGDDDLRSSLGFDNFDGGAGNDTIRLQDIAHFSAGQTFAGGAGTADSLVLESGPGTFDFSTFTITGIERLDLAGSSGAITANFTNTQFAASGISGLAASGGAHALNISGGNVDMSAIDTSGWIFANAQINLTGSNVANILTGSSVRDTISGLDGNDTLVGGGGADLLLAGEGNDAIIYRSGSEISDGFTQFDTIDGGGGTLDRIRQDAAGAVDYSGAAITGVELFSFVNTVGTQSAILSNQHIGAGRIDRFAGDTGVNLIAINSLAGPATINLAAITFSGWTGDTDIVTVNGSSGDDSITGSAFRDILNGGDLSDTIDGGAGNDTINGGAQADRIIGGLGIDELTGGADAPDTFVLQSSASHLDFITDFVSGSDHLEVSAAAFGGGLSAFVGLFNPNLFVANATGLAGDADDRFIYNTATRELTFDSNGNAGGGARIIATFAAGTPDLAFTDINIVA